MLTPTESWHKNDGKIENDFQPPIWDVPYSLFSLGELMEEFEAAWFLEISRDLATFAAVEFSNEHFGPIPEESRAHIRYVLGLLESKAEKCGLKTTIRTIERTYTYLLVDSWTWQQYQERLPIILEVLENKLSTIQLMRLYSEKVFAYNNPALFGDDVNRSFDTAAYDIQEAGNCYALGRNTACVFHLMRVIEVGLEKAANLIGVTLDLEADSPSWDAIIKLIKARVGQIESAMPKELNWRQKRQFAQAIMERIRSIKDAWRNPVMHVVAQHDEQSARSVLNHAEALMRDLAKQMKEITEAEEMPLLVSATSDDPILE